MKHRAAVALLVLTSILWSLGGVLLKSVQWHPLAVSGARSAIASIVFLVWLRRPRFTWSATQIGIALAYFATVSLFVVANQWTTAANAIFLQYTAPIYVAIAGPLLLREPSRPADWLCVAMALVGIGLFLGDDITPTGRWGIIVALGSGLSFAAMVILLRREREGSPLSAILLGNLCTAVIGLPFGLAHLPEPSAWIWLALLGVFQLGVPYILYGIAIRHVSAIEAIIITMLEPVLNPLWVALVQHEIPGGWSLCGAILVLIAVLIRGLSVAGNR